MEPMIYRFDDYNVMLQFATYQTGQTRLALIDINDHSPIAVATVNIPEVKLKTDEVIIKDYSENEGMLEFLVDNNIVSKPTGFIEIGYVIAHVCKLLIKRP